MATNDRLYEQFKPIERAVLTLEALARGDTGEEDRLRQSCPRQAYTMTDPAFHGTLEFIQNLTLITLVDLRWYLGKLWIAEVARKMGPQLTERHAFATRVAFHEGYLLGRGEPAMDLLHDANAEGEVTPTDPEQVPPASKEQDDKPENDDGDTSAGAMTAEEEARFDIPEQYVTHADAFYQRLWTPTIAALAEDFKSVWAAYESFVQETFDLDPLLILRAFCPQVAEQVKRALSMYAKVEP